MMLGLVGCSGILTQDNNAAFGARAIGGAVLTGGSAVETAGRSSILVKF